MLQKFCVFCLWLIGAGCGPQTAKHIQDRVSVPVKNGNLSIAYTLKGSGDTSIVFVHGWCINKEYWQSQIEHFQRHYTVVAPDLGGHGMSGHNRQSWTVNDFAEDVIAVVNTLNLKNVILVGHSMGGDVMLEAATRLPAQVIGFIGIDNFKDINPPISAQLQQSMDEFVKNLKSNYREMATGYSRSYLFPPNYADTHSVNRVIRDIAAADSVMAVQAIESLMKYKEHVHLSALTLPVHLIVSDYTPVNESSLKKYCKAGYSIKTIKGTGHYPMIEKPGEFNQLLEETLSDIARGDSKADNR